MPPVARISRPKPGYFRTTKPRTATATDQITKDGMPNRLPDPKIVLKVLFVTAIRLV